MNDRGEGRRSRERRKVTGKRGEGWLVCRARRGKRGSPRHGVESERSVHKKTRCYVHHNQTVQCQFPHTITSSYLKGKGSTYNVNRLNVSQEL